MKSKIEPIHQGVLGKEPMRVAGLLPPSSSFSERLPTIQFHQTQNKMLRRQKSAYVGLASDIHQANVFRGLGLKV